MSTEMQPQADLLQHTQDVQSALDEQMHQLNTRSFSATDEARTVRVTIDGRRRLTGLDIQDGLLRLGIDAVKQRINEAIDNANAAATETVEVEQQRFVEYLAEAAGSLQNLTNPG